MKLRVLVISVVALVCVFTSGIAMAGDVNCAQYSGTFLQAIQFSGYFSEIGSTDCVSYNITDRTISTEFSFVVNESGVPSDSLTLSNNGTNSTLEICWFSYNDGGPGTSSCGLAANVTTYNLLGDPAVEYLNSGWIFDVPTGLNWYTVMISEDLPGNLSDFVAIKPVPEPASMLLLGTGVLGLAGALRRKICR